MKCRYCKGEIVKTDNISLIAPNYKCLQCGKKYYLSPKTKLNILAGKSLVEKEEKKKK